jgi:C4-dicarboxylate-binding protein DctP
VKAFISYILLWPAVIAPWSSAVAKPQYVVKYTHTALADPMAQASCGKAAVFKAELEKLSGGRIRVDIYPAGQLGDQLSAVQQVRKGAIQITDISSGVLASLYYPKLEIVDLPFLFSSKIIARMVLDNNSPFIKELIADCAKKTGIRILSLAPFGFRHMTNNVRPIRTPDDMKGLKMRTMEIVPHKKLMEAFGATPVPVPWMELYTSLQTKVVDGQENPLQNLVMAKFYQVQKHLTLTGHTMGVGGFLCNEQWYQSLPDDLKLAVVEAEKISRLTFDGFGELLDTLALEELKKYGMQVYSPTRQEIQMFKDKAFPYVRKWMEQEYGQKLVSEFLDSIKAAEAKIKEQTESTLARRK